MITADRLGRTYDRLTRQGDSLGSQGASQARASSSLSNFPALSLAWSSLKQCYGLFLKRGLDALVASTLLLLLLPLLVLASIAIRLDSPGPVLFRQTRIGRHGHPFTIYKFRTMQHHGRDRIEWLVDEQGNVCHKMRHDPRITHVGRWLRRTSIDELPQLLNIILGHMSLIGPRPELPEIVDRYEEWQHRRHLVRPGLTGWWQVSGRSDKPMHEHTELDLFYVENRSFWLDLRIVLLTTLVVFRGLGAF
jgi:exopolysaccharide biosynthesis polyprenyl glycosylphosphotransferase